MFIYFIVFVWADSLAAILFINIPISLCARLLFFFCCLLLMFIGVPPEVLPSVSDHAYTKSSSSKEGIGARRSHVGYSTLSVLDGKEITVSAKVAKQDKHINVLV